MKYKILTFLAFILLTACATTTVGNMKGYVYYSPNNEFQVNKPGSIHSFNYVSDKIKPTVQIVEFSVDNTYWNMSGLYSVAWLLKVSDKSSGDNFIATSKSNVKDIIANKYKGNGSFELISTEETSINNNQSLYFEAEGNLDGIKADWIGNIIKFDNRIAVVSLIIPSNTVWPKPPKEFYAEFVQSLKQI